MGTERLVSGCGGVDLNHRPLGYEPNDSRNFNNLQDAGGALSHCKEQRGIIIGHLIVRREMKQEVINS